MRVTQLESSRNLMSDLNRLNKSFIDENRRLATGKKLNDLADSPLGSAALVDITEQSLRLETYRFNINASSYQLKSADSVLNEANNALSAIYVLGSEGASEAVSSDSRKAIGLQIEKLREQMIAIGNTQVDGRYIFAGSKVTTTPFELSGGSVAYNGNTAANSIPVSDGVEIVAGVTGEQAFDLVFKAIDGLVGAFATDDVRAIESELEKFAGAMSELGQARGQIGTSLSMVEKLSGMLDSRDTVLTEQQSSIEDANEMETIVRISQLKTAIDAALSSGGAILQQSTLFDIIG
ncbi:MAG: flagellar hook-associated protein FlgL [Acidobacteriota bacterium]|jgi:flagellar hook-associated protein 3 FlgL|nr:flagellar hook-associated protein FlgL [Acidobacteriota bacterium]